MAGNGSAALVPLLNLAAIERRPNAPICLTDEPADLPALEKLLPDHVAVACAGDLGQTDLSALHSAHILLLGKRSLSEAARMAMAQLVVDAGGLDVAAPILTLADPPGFRWALEHAWSPDRMQEWLYDHDIGEPHCRIVPDERADDPVYPPELDGPPPAAPLEDEPARNGHDKPKILSSAQFIKGFVPPDYVWDGILQRARVYSMTGDTGSGKTAITLLLKACIGLGRSLAGRDAHQGATLMLAGENPDDVRARWIGLTEQMGFDADDIPVYFMPGTFSINRSVEDIAAFAKDIEGLSFISVDTSAAYFQGDDENSNPQLLEHAKDLRRLTELPGRPTVLANCHPVKRATRDNLLPRGGGSFLNEMDGNLTCWKENTMIEMHTAGKFRGPEFEPISFELVPCVSDRMRDSRGRHVPTVIARAISRSEQEAKAAAALSDEQKVLNMLAGSKMLSIAELAIGLGWVNQAGEPLKARAQRFTETMKRDGFIKRHGQIWEIGDVGRRMLEQMNER